MLTQNEREEKGRSIRKHLLNWQDHRGQGSTAAGARRELKAAAAELDILLVLEGIGGDSGEEKPPETASEGAEGSRETEEDSRKAGAAGVEVG